MYDCKWKFFSWIDTEQFTSIPIPSIFHCNSMWNGKNLNLRNFFKVKKLQEKSRWKSPSQISPRPMEFHGMKIQKISENLSIWYKDRFKSILNHVFQERKKKFVKISARNLSFKKRSSKVHLKCVNRLKKKFEWNSMCLVRNVVRSLSHSQR